MKRSVTTLIIAIAICIFTGNASAVEVAGMNVHGLLSQGYVKTSDNNFFSGTKNGTYQFNEFALNFSRDISDKLHAGAQLFARDLGTTGNDKLEIDWAYADYHFKDWLGIRAGKVKVPHGLYNETRDVDMLRVSIFLPQSVYPEVLRDTTLSTVGGGIYGNIGLWIFGELSYQAVIGMHDQNIDANERTKQAFMDATSNNDKIRTDDIDVLSKYAGSIVWETPLDGLKVSGTMGNSKMSITSVAIQDDPPMMSIGDIMFMHFDKFQYIVYSSEYTWNRLVVAAEYMKTKRSYRMGFNNEGSMGGGNKDELRSTGWYVTSTYQAMDWFSLGAYYSKTTKKTLSRVSQGGAPGGAPAGAAPASGNGVEADDPGRTYQKDLCLSARFDLNDYLTFKLEGHNIKGTNGLSALDNPADAGGKRWTNDWRMYAAKVTFNF
jgi:hypothetical protein